MRTRTIFFGTPLLALPTLEMLAQHPSIEIILVITPPDTPVGRKQVLTPCPVKVMANKLGLPVYQPETLRDAEVQKKIIELCPDLIILAAYGKIIPAAILNTPKFKALNIHPSALPKYRGASPMPNTLLNGDKMTATSIMIMEPTLDTGPIVAQKEVAVPPKTDYLALEALLGKISAKVLHDVLDDWLAGNITPREQDHSRATYTQILKREDGLINWSKPAYMIENQIYAFSPWPGTYTNYQGKRIKILAGNIAPENTAPLSAGEIKIANNQLIVGCGEKTAMLIENLQEEGKKPMTAAEFIPGHPQWQGAKLA